MWMLKVFPYSKADIHLYNVHWVYLNPPRISLSQPSGFVLDIWSQIAAVCSGEKEMRRGIQPGMLSPTSRAPQKKHIQAFSSKSFHQTIAATCQPGACADASPSQGLPLTLCTYSPLPWHSGSLFLLTSGLQFEKTVVLSLHGTGRQSHCILLQASFLQPKIST